MKPEEVGKKLLPQGTIVYFDTTTGIVGYGRIMGIANSAVAILGYTYIVEPLFDIPQQYYNCITIFERWIDLRRSKLYDFLKE